jgi:hypothetical protein
MAATAFTIQDLKHRGSANAVRTQMSSCFYMKQLLILLAYFMVRPGIRSFEGILKNKDNH